MPLAYDYYIVNLSLLTAREARALADGGDFHERTRVSRGIRRETNVRDSASEIKALTAFRYKRDGTQALTEAPAGSKAPPQSRKFASAAAVRAFLASEGGW